MLFIFSALTFALETYIRNNGNAKITTWLFCGWSFRKKKSCMWKKYISVNKIEEKDAHCEDKQIKHKRDENYRNRITIWWDVWYQSDNLKYGIINQILDWPFLLWQIFVQSIGLLQATAESPMLNWYWLVDDVIIGEWRHSVIGSKC